MTKCWRSADSPGDRVRPEAGRPAGAERQEDGDIESAAAWGGEEGPMSLSHKAGAPKWGSSPDHDPPRGGGEVAAPEQHSRGPCKSKGGQPWPAGGSPGGHDGALRGSRPRPAALLSLSDHIRASAFMSHSGFGDHSGDDDWAGHVGSAGASGPGRSCGNDGWSVSGGSDTAPVDHEVDHEVDPEGGRDEYQWSGSGSPTSLAAALAAAVTIPPGPQDSPPTVFDHPVTGL